MGVNLSKQKSTQKSSNQAYPFLRDALGDTVGYTNQGAGGIAALLGGDSSGFDAFKSATGFDTQLGEGLSDITGAGAARGLLRSGSTGKAYVNYGQELQNKTAQSYIQNLLGLSQVGLGAASTIGGAGNTSESQSKGKSLGYQAPSPAGGWGG